MSWSRGIFAVAVAAFAPFFLAAAADRARPPELRGQIVIGGTFPLTGELAYYGQSAYYGANTRVRLINEAGGVNGKRLVINWRDNRSDPEQAARDVEELAREAGVAAVLGPLLSDAAMAARETARRLGVVVMTPLATVDAATRDNPWMFRACFNNSAEAEGLIAFQMNSYGASSCGIVYDSRHAFSTELAAIFAKKFTEKGGRVVGKRSIVDAAGAKDYASPLRTIAEEKPDFIFATCYALEAAELVRAARDLAIDIRFCGSDSWDNELLFDAAGRRLIGTSLASALFERDFNYRPFRVFYDAMEAAGMDTPDAPAACAYDAVTLLADALAGGEGAEDVRQGLLSVKRKALATGRVTITPDGDTLKPMLIRVIEQRGGRLAPIYAERFDP